MTGGVMPPGGPRATSAQIKVLSDWIAAGFPSGSGSCGGGPAPGAGGAPGGGPIAGAGGAPGGGTMTGAGGAPGGAGGARGGAGGAPGGTTTTGGTGSGLPCDVESVVQSQCQGCHSSPPRNGAPFSLVTRADLQAHGTAAVSAMSSGAMPPSGPRASAAEIQTLQNWLNAGAPAGTCGGTTTGGGSGGAPGGTTTSGSGGAPGGTTTGGAGGAPGGTTTGAGGDDHGGGDDL
jgi:hypothetical protein